MIPTQEIFRSSLALTGQLTKLKLSLKRKTEWKKRGKNYCGCINRVGSVSDGRVIGIKGNKNPRQTFPFLLLPEW